jgi:polygalacturonase
MTRCIASLVLVAGIALSALGGYYSTPALPNLNTNNVIVITNAAYGGKGDNATDNTVTIQAAIVAAAAGGVTNGAAGGTVEIPPGIYLCGFC